MKYKFFYFKSVAQTLGRAGPKPVSKKLKDIVTEYAKPGQNEIHQASSMNCLPSLTLLPHAGIGSGIPAPRKDRADSVSISPPPLQSGDYKNSAQGARHNVLEQ
ncbi:MAG: hypothetical protein CM1200mP39_27530 [Dehalococcoidia bacterium]|nr:MAG: hypothetical protein CM1200mP39_27530 [Dehalococcoidia bacterium]